MRICVCHRLSNICSPKCVFGCFESEDMKILCSNPQKALPCVNTRLLVYHVSKLVKRPKQSWTWVHFAKSNPTQSTIADWPNPNQSTITMCILTYIQSNPLSRSGRVGKYHDILDNIKKSKISQIFLIFSIFSRKWKFLISYITMVVTRWCSI